jgi:malonate-semialdehyde dehydrogenase (acetylating) / methylmalonate-semialdehyde dehydrogenase
MITAPPGAGAELPIVPSVVGGRPVAGGTLLDVTDPATGTVIARVGAADAGVVAAAVAAARAALPGWRDTLPAVRARHLMKLRELLERDKAQLAGLITREHGKPTADAFGSIQRGIEVVEFACAAPQLLKGENSDAVAAGVATRSSRRPVGVCVGITPYNYPAMIPLWMFPMALACGNTFVLKPSEKTPSAANRLAELVAEAGVPAGVFNVAHGGRDTAHALITHPDVAAVSFVGSSAVAASVYASAAAVGKRVQALGGAKNHAIVLPDADLDLAVDGLLNGAFNSAGQRCMAIAVVVPVGEVAEPLLARLRERAAALKVGPGTEADTYVPPISTREQFDKVRRYVQIGIDEGATLLLDGRSPPVPPACQGGFFVGPTILDRATPAMRVYREEIFGPVAVVVRAGSLDEAIALSNAHPLGNGAVLYTRSGAAAAKFEREIECGMPGVNVPVPSPVAYYTFGGAKGSLYGDLAAHGPDAVNFYTRRQTLTTRWA